MAESAYLRLSYALCAANDKFTMCGLRHMISHGSNYRRWLQRYVFERHGLDWRSVQREMRQEFIDAFGKFTWRKPENPFPSKWTILDRNSSR